MKVPRWLIPGAVMVGFVSPALSEDGIHVAPPKVYDDAYLESQLKTLKARLSTIGGYDAATLTGKLGSLQGGHLQQSGFNLNLLGAPTPSVKTTVSPGASTPGTESTQGALTPAVPSSPSLGLALPTAFSASSLDTLNEMTQLNYHILNLQLLLEGAVSDQFQLRGGAKKRLTLGFPVVFERNNLDHDGKLAEVEVTVCNNTKAEAREEIPSVVTILPVENTYNTVSITDQASSIGVGAIAGAFSVGGNFIWGNKTYYIVKQQDTRALLRPPRTDVVCGMAAVLPVLPETPDRAVKLKEEERKLWASNVRIIEVRDAEHKIDLAHASEPFSTVFKFPGEFEYKQRVPRATFAWQFLPALGQPAVKPGLRHVFVQLAVPNPHPNVCSGKVFVKKGWRDLPRKQYLIDWFTPRAPEPDPVEVDQIYEYDTRPYSFDVQVQDLGNGSVMVRAGGSFLEGLRVRVGANLIDPNSSGFASHRKFVQFTSSAAALVTNEVHLVGSDGVSHPLQFYPPDISPQGPKGCTPYRSGHVPPRLLEIDYAYSHPLNETHSRVVIRKRVMTREERSQLTGGEERYRVRYEAEFPLVALVGGKAYGLQDSPFEKYDERTGEIWIVATNESLRASPTVRLQRLLMGPAYVSKWHPLVPPHTIQATLVAAGKPVVISLSGKDVGGLCLFSPSPAEKCGVVPALTKAEGKIEMQRIGNTFALVSLPTDLAANTKQLLFTPENQAKGEKPLIIPINIPVEAKPPAPSAAPKLDELTDIKVGTPRIVVTGPNLEQVAGIKFMDQWLNFLVAPGSKSLVLDLPPAATASEGIRYLEVIAADRSTTRYRLEVKKP